MQALVKALRKAEPLLEITIIAFQYPFQSNSYVWNGVPVYPMGGKNRGGLRKLRTWQKTISVAQRLHRTKPFTHIHSFWLGECALIGHRLAKNWGLPHFCTLMGQDILKSNHYQKIISIKNIHTVAVSPRQAEQWKKDLGKSASAVIPWGIDWEGVGVGVNSYDAGIRDLVGASSNFTRAAGGGVGASSDVTGVGSLIGLKRFALFLSVVEVLVQQFPDLRATLVGDGPERASLEQLAIQKKLPIRFTGALPRQEVLQIMASSKVLLHPSAYESFGFVYLEALAAGAKVVSFPTGYAPAGKNHYVGHHVAELAVLCAMLLKEPQEQRIPEIPRTMDHCAAEYLYLYAQPFNTKGV